jgi:hypothetical protein
VLLQASVRAVEGVYMRVQEHLDREMASMSKVGAHTAGGVCTPFTRALDAYQVL